MLRQQAFTGENKMLKGGLHCHTTRSDGKVPPDEVIRLYHQCGYDFVSLTDHRIYNYKNFAPEVPITIIPGMEYDNLVEKGKGFRCYHTVCIGPSQDDGNGFLQDQRFESGKEPDQEGFQKHLDMIHENGNLTIYCHPERSSTPARYFENLKGNFAMEIWNTSNAYQCGTDASAAYWDELLGQGKRIYGVATDDAHIPSIYCKGWVMVNAKNNIQAILKALREGAFYSSCGPEIYDFYVEDDKAVIVCSPTVSVLFRSDMHPGIFRKEPDGTKTVWEVPLNRNEFRYLRAEVCDAQGRKAWTNPVFFDE